MKIREKYLSRCLQLAKNGLGTSYPNPLVGCVIVYNDKIIGEGWHREAGGPHAEVIAIQSVKNKTLLKESTLYVNLEPCSHYGKTPPCSDLIIDKKIKNVVIGTIDPFKKVAGLGIKKLMKAGGHVKVGVLEEAAEKLNKRFFTFHRQKRPYLILKWAQSEDGFIAPQKQQKGKPVWITSNVSKQLVHQWRSEEQAILVGTETAVKDNPQLNTRLWSGKNPTRLVLDRQLRIPAQTLLFEDNGQTLVITDKNSKKDLPQYLKSNSNIEVVFIDFDKEIAEQICHLLYEKNLQSVIIEGGRKTLQTFINANIWDEARVFTGNKTFGQGIPAPSLPAKMTSKKKLAKDVLTIYENQKCAHLTVVKPAYD